MILPRWAQVATRLLATWNVYPRALSPGFPLKLIPRDTEFKFNMIRCGQMLDREPTLLHRKITSLNLNLYRELNCQEAHQKLPLVSYLKIAGVSEIIMTLMRESLKINQRLAQVTIWRKIAVWLNCTDLLNFSFLALLFSDLMTSLSGPTLALESIDLKGGELYY